MTFLKRTKRIQCLTDQILPLDGMIDLLSDQDYQKSKIDTGDES